MFKPIEREKTLTIGNPESAIGIVSLWSNKDTISSQIPKEHYAVIGQLYSGTRGLDPLIRNLLANPHIRYLLLYGQDLAGSGTVLKDFFTNGCEMGLNSAGMPCWKVKSAHAGYVDAHITEEALHHVRSNVSLIPVASVQELAEKAEALAAAPAKPHAEPMHFAKSEKRAETFPGEATVYRVSGSTVAEAWVRLLNIIMRFGKISPTHYESRTKEIIDLVTVITDEDPVNLYIPEFLPCNARMLEEYFPRVLSSEQFHETKYTYGQRLRSHFGIDQVDAMIQKLCEEREIRSCVASLWDPRIDNKKGGAPGLSPCLNHIWAKVADGRLTLTAVIRSNDMFSAWPENAFALRKLQALVAEGVSKRTKDVLPLGDLIVISQSAHIYEDCWDEARSIVSRFRDEYIMPEVWSDDPRGSFVIDINEGMITAEHIGINGEHCTTYSGRTAREMYTAIAADSAVFLAGHAFYLGKELMKAELACTYPEQFLYVQDKPLSVKGSRK